MAPLILASGSPRRREILEQLGLEFSVIAADVDETIEPKWSIEEAVVKLAEKKALEVSKHHPNVKVLGSDTMVVFQEVAYGKPSNREEAQKWLTELSGKCHKVLTSVAIAQNDQVLCSDFQETKVYFRHLAPEEIEWYLSTGDFADKAGAYGIQSFGARLVDRLEGCFYNVMGLPITLTLNLLNEQTGE